MRKAMYKLGMLAFALVMTMTAATPVKAARVSWEFKREATGDYDDLVRSTTSKATSIWKIELEETKYTNLSTQNVLECKVVDANGTRTSDVEQFKKYGTYKKAYNKTQKKGASEKLKGKKATTSTAGGKLVIWGFFTP